jgi:hypothetical protein
VGAGRLAWSVTPLPVQTLTLSGPYEESAWAVGAASAKMAHAAIATVAGRYFMIGESPELCLNLLYMGIGAVV